MSFFNHNRHLSTNISNSMKTCSTYLKCLRMDKYIEADRRYSIQFARKVKGWGSRSQWPRGLRRRSPAYRLLWLRFQIPPGRRFLSRVSVLCCQVKVPAPGLSLVLKCPTWCILSERDREISKGESSGPPGLRAIKKKLRKTKGNVDNVLFTQRNDWESGGISEH